MFARFARRIIEAGGQQFADSPNMIRDPKRHSWRLADGFMQAAKNCNAQHTSRRRQCDDQASC